MKEIIPGVGEKTTKQKLRDLEKKAGTLPVIFALLFTEAIKISVAGLPIPYVPESAWFHFIFEALKFLLLAIFIAMLYVFEEERREVIGMAKEKSAEKAEGVKEKTDEVKEKASKDENKPDYEAGVTVFGKQVKCSLSFNKSEK